MAGLTWLGRPVPWGAVLASYIGLVGLFGYGLVQADDRATADCRLFELEYKNDVQSLRDARHRLASQLDYVRDPSDAIDPDLRARIREVIPLSRQTVERERQEAVDSVPPDYCS